MGGNRLDAVRAPGPTEAGAEDLQLPRYCSAKIDPPMLVDSRVQQQQVNMRYIPVSLSTCQYCDKAM